MLRPTLLAAALIGVSAVAPAVISAPLVAQEPEQRRGRAETPEPVVPPGDSITLVLTQPLKGRAIGPAVMGGRVSDVALDPKDPYTFYVALGTGGVMKTSDNGGSFEAVFEKQPVAAIGAVTVAPSDSSVVWVGSGEANDRNSTSWGDGVYLSTDAGATWKNVGLKASKSIARIAVHPTDARTAYVAAAGDLWNDGGERGLYKTTDGGATWRRVLAAPAPYDARTGAGDVALDPQNPNTVYAALYARQRKPWAFVYGAEHTGGKDVGGIFRSTDGGATWKKLAGGLPAQTGRIGLAIYAKNPKIVYAVVQSDEGGTTSIDEVRSKRGGVFRSDDGGETWTRMSGLNPRPFYFSQIRVDPSNDQKVYVLGFSLHVSENGGRSWREDRSKNIHPDLHALAIDPRRPQRLVLGTDGGPYQSYNGGASWAHLNTMAAGEFYRISVDSSTPYRICGGLQDNLNWMGPSRTRSKEGITNADWTNIEGGDGFYCVFDPDDRDVIYAESQAGYVHRMNVRTGEMKVLRPEPTEGQTAFRFHWNSPLVPSPHAKGTIYLGGNRVFKLTSRGDHWTAISPDLSTNDVNKIMATGSGAENYGVVYTVAESPAKAGLLWAGTDDGKLWRSDDGGARWADLTAGLPAPARGQWISRVEPSARDAAVAYLAVDAHRTGNYAPLAYRTGDGGRTWQSIAANLPAGGPVKVVREDPVNPNLLYAGTEFGLFASVDRGRRWFKFGGLPTVAVDDIVVHPRDRDLVAATHGRSLYVVDDVRPLQELTPAVMAKDVHLFAPRPAEGFYPLSGWAAWAGSAQYRGENPPEGALISFYVRRYTGDPVKISIADAAGQPVANLTGAGTPGINRVSWDLKPTKDLLSEYGGEGPKFVPSGEYTVTLTQGQAKETTKLTVKIAEGIETR